MATVAVWPESAEAQARIQHRRGRGQEDAAQVQGPGRRAAPRQDPRLAAHHPAPLRLREGLVEEITLATEMPFGLEPGRSFQVQPLALEPGDRIVFVTDGMLERHAADLDFHTTLRDTAHLHPREVVHALGAAVLRIAGLSWAAEQIAAGTCRRVLAPGSLERERPRPSVAPAQLPGPENLTPLR